MESQKPMACPAIWLSGFFALGAIVHVVRLLFRFSLIVGGYEIPLGVSALVAVVLGGLSIGLLILGCKKPCCSKE